MCENNPWVLVKDAMNDQNNKELFLKAYRAIFINNNPSLIKDALKKHKNYIRWTSESI